MNSAVSPRKQPFVKAQKHLYYFSRLNPCPWPAPSRQFEQFLGFSNFCRRFICDYSKVTTHLTQLTSIASLFARTPKADTAFKRLNQLFTSAPVLIHPDPALQFVVEVDGSNSVLFQRCSRDQKVHPCQLFSRKLFPGERNCDSNR